MKGCLLDYSYFKYNYQLVLILASKKAFVAYPIAFPQIEFNGDLRTSSQIFSILENLKKQF